MHEILPLYYSIRKSLQISKNIFSYSFKLFLIHFNLNNIYNLQSLTISNEYLKFNIFSENWKYWLTKWLTSISVNPSIFNSAKLEVGSMFTFQMKISQYTHSPIKLITRTPPTHQPWKAVIPQARAIPVCMHSCENITHTKLHWGRDNMQLSNVQYLHQSKQNGASGKKGAMQTFRTQHALRGGTWFEGKGCMPLTQKFMKCKPNHRCSQYRGTLTQNGEK